MLRVYKWIEILDNVITPLSSVMRKWNTRLEIRKDGKNVSVDELILCVVSSKVIGIPSLVFVYLKSQYVKSQTARKKRRNVYS